MGETGSSPTRDPIIRLIIEHDVHTGPEVRALNIGCKGLNEHHCPENTLLQLLQSYELRLKVNKR